MLKKRFTSLFLALAMVLGLSVPTLAAEMEETQIEAEIQTMEQEVYAEVYRQLEAQGGLHMMDTYKEILAPKIRAAVEAEHTPVGYSTMATSNPWTQRAPKGGLVTYTMMGNVEVREDYMDKDTTNLLLTNNLPDYDPTLKQLTLKWIIKATIFISLKNAELSEALLELIGEGFLDAIIYTDQYPKKSINDCGGYACVIATSDPTLPTKYTVTVAWKSYPNISVNTTSVISGDPVFLPGHSY